MGGQVSNGGAAARPATAPAAVGGVVSARSFAAPLSLVVLLSLAAGCNQLTGASGLKVARCGPDARPDAGECETELGTLNAGGASGRPRDPELGPEGGPRAEESSGGGGSRGSNGMRQSLPPGQLSCEPGTLVQCLGPDSCSGTQTCQEDGVSVSGCECGPEPVVSAGSVGAACAGDADCSRGLGCTTAEASSGPFFGGGVQGGFCSRPCAGDADCVAADPGAICVSHASGPAFCFQECATTQLSFPEQCNGRSDLLCLPLSGSQRGYCAPACQTDGDCAPRACDLASGLCADSVSEGEAIGGACSADGDCAAGLCLSLPGQSPACTGLCTLGSVAGCGFGEREPERSAACTNGAAADLGLGLGVGLCQELCDVDEDCLQAESGWGCSPWSADADSSGQSYEDRFGSIGFCEPQLPGGSELAGNDPESNDPDSSDPESSDPDGSDPDDGDPGCNDSCLFASNGSCDDEESFLPLCDPGTDCSDCGPR